MKITPPASETELLQRAQGLAGKALGQLADILGTPVPLSLHHAKGWIGQFIEKLLGANAASLDQPDFVNLGIELKTLPIDSQGIPCESTYICAITLPHLERQWEQSRVWRKMARMLWIPIETVPNKTLNHSRIGTPLLWSPSEEIAQQLKQDWEELTEMVAIGLFDQLSAHQGKFLQIRPKAANAKTFAQVIDHEGQKISVVPKGFYLRKIFTHMLIKKYYLC